MVLMGTQSNDDVWEVKHSNLLRKFGKGHRNWVTFLLLERGMLCSCDFTGINTSSLGVILTGWLFKSVVFQHFECLFVIIFFLHPLSFVCTWSGSSLCLDFILFYILFPKRVVISGFIFLPIVFLS